VICGGCFRISNGQVFSTISPVPFFILHRRENRYKTKSRWRKKGRQIGEKKLQGEGDVILNQTDRCKGDEGGARQKKGIRDGEEKVAEGGERIGTYIYIYIFFFFQ
jgi:hypothetical protein